MGSFVHLIDQRRLIGPGGSTTSGEINFYYSGTSIPAPVYQDIGMSVPSPNPVVVAAGEVVPLIFLDTAILYRRVIEYSDGSTDDQDPLGEIFTEGELGLPIGAILDYAGTVAPEGFLFCYGQEVSRSDYEDLFAAVGTTYGAGNGSTTFNLPDYRGRVSAGKDNMGGVAASRLTDEVNGLVLGSAGGSEGHILSLAELAAHNHGGSTTGTGNHSHVVKGFLSSFSGGSSGAETQTGTLGSGIASEVDGSHSHTIPTAGSNEAHNNVQPTIVLNKIIKTSATTFLSLIELLPGFDQKANAVAVGIGPSDLDMGSFTGSTIPDGSTAKEALQALETSVENIVADSISMSILERRYIDVAEFCSTNDSLDAFAGVQAAFDQGYGREIVFTNPVGGTRFYRSLSRANGSLLLPRKARIIFEDKAILDFSSIAASGSSMAYMKGEGTVASANLLAANATLGSRTVTVGPGVGSNYSRGMYAYVGSDAYFTTEDATLGKKGEWVRIVSVAGDILTVAGELRDTYNTADNARITRLVDPLTVAIENINLNGCGKFSAGANGDRGVELINGVGCRMSGGSISWSDMFGTLWTNVLNGTIEGLDIVREENAASNPTAYGVAIASGCENILVQNNDVTHGREGYCLTVSGALMGVTRDVTFAYNRARGMWRSGYASHDTHANWTCIGNLAEDVEQGFDCRIIDATFTKNKIRRTGAYGMGLDCGFQLGSGSGNVRFEGNEYDDILRGIYMPSAIVHEALPGDITIKGEVMRGVRAHGVMLDYRTASSPVGALGTVTVTDCDIDCVTSGSSPRGVELHGQWTAPVIARNTFRGGNANRVVYLHATNNVGTIGASDPVIVDNEYTSGYTVPLVQHATGITKLDRNRGIGHWTSGERLTGSKTFDFASAAGAYGAFASTTVTVTGAAVGDYAVAWTGLGSPLGYQVQAHVSAADTVTVYVIPFSSSAVDLANTTVYAAVTKA